jgi:hypothetical protein
VIDGRGMIRDGGCSDNRTAFKVHGRDTQQRYISRASFTAPPPFSWISISRQLCCAARQTRSRIPDEAEANFYTRMFLAPAPLPGGNVKARHQEGILECQTHREQKAGYSPTRRTQEVRLGGADCLAMPVEKIKDQPHCRTNHTVPRRIITLSVRRFSRPRRCGRLGRRRCLSDTANPG